MKTPAFSEFTFGYAFTENITRWLPDVDGVPLFPSLSEEGKRGVGYDVKIPRKSAPLFLQYKIPQIVTRRSKLLPPGFSPPYFRMHLHRGDKSSQHQSLLQHSQGGHAVFYVCPRFTRLAELDTHYRARAVPQECLYIDPIDIGTLDHQDHFVAFENTLSVAWLFSESKQIHPPMGGDQFREVIYGLVDAAEDRPVSDESMDELAHSMLRIIRSTFVPPRQEASSNQQTEMLVRDFPPDRGVVAEDLARALDDMPPATRVAYIARYYLSAEVLFVSRRGSQA